ncbi:MAG: hypothetical protein WAO02_14830 [Verrucomicrobiia bacterium]
MKINPAIVAAVLAAMFGLLGWTLFEVVTLKVEVARIETHLGMTAKSN